MVWVGGVDRSTGSNDDYTNQSTHVTGTLGHAPWLTSQDGSGTARRLIGEQRTMVIIA